MANEYDIDDELKTIRQKAPSLGKFSLLLASFALKIMMKKSFKKHKSIMSKVNIPVADGAIDLFIIKPHGLAANAPCLVYYHGGAFTFGTSPQHLEYAIHYANEARCCVVFVDYRLAPRFAFPVGFDDGYAALLWVLKNAQKLNIDTDRIALGGDSAGGALAASVAQKASVEMDIKLCGQMLIYPVTDQSCQTESAKKYTDTPVFNGIANKKMWDVYLKNVDRHNPPPYASPIDGLVQNMPKAYIEIAEFDPLHDEGFNYAEKMRINGDEVEIYEIEGGVHGYDLLVPDSEVSKISLAHRCRFLTEIFS